MFPHRKVRIRVDALSNAFLKRSVERRTSHLAHKLALGAFALESALAEGRPFEAELSVLQAGCGEDPLVAAAVKVLPKGLAQTGVWTRAQISDRSAPAAQLLEMVPVLQLDMLTPSLQRQIRICYGH